MVCGTASEGPLAALLILKFPKSKTALMCRGRNHRLWLVGELAALARRLLLFLGTLLLVILVHGFFLSLESLPLSLLLHFSLFLKHTFILHENELFKNNSFVRVFDRIDGPVIFRELLKSLCVHIKSDVGAFELILVLVVKFRLRKMHGSYHHGVRNKVFNLLLFLLWLLRAPFAVNLLLLRISTATAVAHLVG